jgi:hypothetical protein
MQTLAVTADFVVSFIPSTPQFAPGSQDQGAQKGAASMLTAPEISFPYRACQ